MLILKLKEQKTGSAIQARFERFAS